jgi:Mn2+/Fe2+ NRAMP family transporter
VSDLPTTPLSPVVAPSKPRLWNALGPGLVTGAADDDPSGIATYSQAGAAFGFQLAWTLLKALVWAAVLNGIVAVPVMVLLMLLCTRASIMGQFRISRRWAVIGWAATVIMGVASGAFILAMLQPPQ